jgi:hypothetical protein
MNRGPVLPLPPKPVKPPPLKAAKLVIAEQPVPPPTEKKTSPRGQDQLSPELLSKINQRKQANP